MFERFTDRARKSMAFANQEAQRLNHEYIGTEHILLGLLKEGSGVGANVLKNLGVELEIARLEILKLVKSGDKAVTGKNPQTPRTKLVIEYAIEEARRLSHNYVGTEHLLLGLVRETDGVAALVLANLGVTVSSARVEVLGMLGVHDDSMLAMDSEEVNELGAIGVHFVGRRDLKKMIDLCLDYDPRIRVLERAKEEAICDGDYERAAKLRDDAIRAESHRDDKKLAIGHIVSRDGSLAKLLNDVLKDMPDRPVTPGWFLLEFIAENPELAYRLRPVMDEIRKACEDV